MPAEHEVLEPYFFQPPKAITCTVDSEGRIMTVKVYSSHEGGIRQVPATHWKVVVRENGLAYIVFREGWNREEVINSPLSSAPIVSKEINDGTKPA